MKKFLILITLILMGSVANASEWIKSPIVDSLTGLSLGDFVYAVSDNSVDVKLNKFSKQTIRTKAIIYIMPNGIQIRLLDGGNIDCTECVIRVLFDGMVTKCDVASDDEKNALFILHEYKNMMFENATMGAKRIRVEVPFYKQGNEIFEFNFIAPLNYHIYKQKLKKK